MRYVSHSYKFAEEVLNSKLSTKREILEIIGGLQLPKPIPPKGSGNILNSQLRKEFRQRKWEVEAPIHPELNLTTDFRKNRVQVEAQFGNVSRYYADIFKFQVSHLMNTADVGVLIVLKREWARKIGSNIASFERAKGELEILKLIIPMPIWIIGLEP